MSQLRSTYRNPESGLIRPALLLTSIALAVALSCAAVPPTTSELVAVYRFVNVGRAGMLIPRVDLDGEILPVLSRPDQFKLVADRKFEIPEDRHLRLRWQPPDGVVNGEWVVLESMWRSGRKWHPLANTASRSEQRAGESRPGIETAVDVPEAAGDSARLSVTLYNAFAETRWSREYDPVAIPANASLGFSLAVLPPAWEMAPAQFELEACTTEGCSPIFREAIDPREPAQRGWQDRTVDLRDLAHQQVRLRFSVRALADGDRPAVTLPAWGDPVLYAPRIDSTAPPNLILISLSGFRADRISAFGYPRKTTPFVDDWWVEGGTAFEHAVAASAATAASSMTMLTALPPQIHGATLELRGPKLPIWIQTLPEVLRTHGFRTASLTEGGPVRASRGTDRGFDRVVEREPLQSDHEGTEIERQLDLAIEWIGLNRALPFFLFLQSSQVAEPFHPPPGYRDLFPDPIPGIDPLDGLRRSSRPVRYDREIRFADDQLRKFVERLDALGVLDNSILVLTSDRGHAFLEHGFLGYGADLHEEVIHVPLLVRGPGVPKGARIQTPIGHVDLMPTLLDFMSFDVPAQSLGQSFASDLRGNDARIELDSSLEERPVHSEAWMAEARLERGKRRFEPPRLAVRVGPRKLLRDNRKGGHDYTLYDLERDPLETRNALLDDPGGADDLIEWLDGYEERLRQQLLQTQRTGFARLRDARQSADRDRVVDSRGLGTRSVPGEPAPDRDSVQDP